MDYSSNETLKAVGEFIKGKIPDLTPYAKKTDIPSKLPADGGDADTVNGHIVNADVPANAKFTDTTYSAASASGSGLMTAAMVTKLNGIAAGANAYTLPTASTNLGGVKTTSTVTSTSGLTACPIISGVPYYKDTNTTYSAMTGATASAAGKAGLVPAPAAGSQDKFLGANGAWVGAEKWLGRVTDTTFIDTTTTSYPYICAVAADVAKTMGLPEYWWHIEYMPHAVNADGYGMQIAYPLNATGIDPRYRISRGKTWQSWAYFGAASSQHQIGTTPTLSEGTKTNISVNFDPKVVLLLMSGHVITAGYAIVMGTKSFAVTPASISTMGTTRPQYIAFG